LMTKMAPIVDITYTRFVTGFTATPAAPGMPGMVAVTADVSPLITETVPLPTLAML